MTLKQLILDRIEEMGASGAAEHYGVSVATISRWASGKGDPSFKAAEQAFTDFQTAVPSVEREEAEGLREDDFEGVEMIDDPEAFRSREREALEKNQTGREFRQGGFGLNQIKLDEEKLARASKLRLGPGEREVSDEEFRRLDGVKTSPAKKAVDPSSVAPGVESIPNTVDGGQVLTEEQFRALARSARSQDRSPDVIAKPAHFEKSEAQLKRDVMILFPSERMISPAVAEGVYARLRDQNRHRFIRNQMHFIPDARNDLAERFLKSDCEWSFWADSDMLFPSGPKHADWFLRTSGAKKIPRKFAELHTIDQLLSREKTLIGGVYSPRKYGAKPLSSKSLSELKSGPIDRVEKVDWLAAGCMLVHRSVYEDISRKAGGGDYAGWFDLDRSITKFGEDVAFSYRAKSAGHDPFLDLSIACAHIGSFSFLIEHQP